MYLEHARVTMLYLQNLILDAMDKDNLYPDDLRQSVVILENIRHVLTRFDNEKDLMNGMNNLTLTAQVCSRNQLLKLISTNFHLLSDTEMSLFKEM